MKLFVSPTCPFCQRAEIAALERGVAYERVLVPLRENMPDWYKAMNPRETVPTLQVDGAKLVFESNLIARYFDNSGTSGKTLMGHNPYQRHRIEFFMNEASDFIGACHNLLEDPLSGEKRKAVDENAAYVDGILAENQVTGPFFCDAEFTMADVVVVPFLIRMKIALMYYCGYDVFSKAPHLKRLWAAALERPSVKNTTCRPEEYVESMAHLLPESAPMMPARGGYVLYGNKFCPFVDRVRLACAVKKFKPFWVEINLPVQPPWYKFINVRETVPALTTPQGEAIHESQLIVQYIDSAFPDQGRALVPRGKADDEYKLGLFTESVGTFLSAAFGVAYGGASQTAKEELKWAAGELEAQLREAPFGAGPFHGGATMHAGDLALLPMLVRIRAYTPELMGGYDVFAAFPLLGKFLTAGLHSEEAAGIFAEPSVYLASMKARLARK